MRTAFFFFVLSWILAGPLAFASPRIELTLSVDWEGDDLQDENLAAMADFRSDYPGIPLVHFLNAAYFTHEGAEASSVREKIRSVLREGDELGLHIHGWEDLFLASGVGFHAAPTFWGNPSSVPSAGGLGHDVPISSYTTEELRKVIHFSVQKLGENGFHDLKSFRAGGWLASPEVLEALAQEGFVADSSAVPPELLEDRIGTKPLWGWLAELWRGIRPTSQPYRLATRGGESLEEFPDNLALADYVRADQVAAAFEDLAARATEEEPLRLHFGFHQETAAVYLSRVRAALDKIRAYSDRNGLSWSPVKLRSDAFYIP